MKQLTKITIFVSIFIITFVSQNQNVLSPYVIQGKNICVDPGHGGRDPGATVNGIDESDIALSISLYLKNNLETLGAKVIMTRMDDSDLSHASSRNKKHSDLSNRVKLINDSGCQMLISIHLNYISSSKWNGAQSFYYSDNSKSLAQSIQKYMEIRLGSKRKAMRKTNVYILKNTKVEAALVEVGFLSNPQERNKLTTPSYQKEIAHAITYGLIHYLDN